MIVFYRKDKIVYAVHTLSGIDSLDLDKLSWLFSNAENVESKNIDGFFVGPRKEMITPWSTNAVEITQNMGINGILRIEEFEEVESKNSPYDPMLKSIYNNLDQDIFTIDVEPDPIIYIDDIKE